MGRRPAEPGGRRPTPGCRTRAPRRSRSRGSTSKSRSTETHKNDETRLRGLVGSSTSSTDSASWASFELAIAVADQADGIGFVFSADDPFCGQARRLLDGEHLHPEVAARVLALGSYTEISPSGNGVKTIVRGSKNGTTRCRTSKTPWGGRFECYDAERFFTITGQLLPGMPATIAEAQAELDAVLAEYLPKPTPPNYERARNFAPVDLDNQELVEFIRDKYPDLWAGRWEQRYGHRARPTSRCATGSHG